MMIQNIPNELVLIILNECNCIYELTLVCKKWRSLLKVLFLKHFNDDKYIVEMYEYFCCQQKVFVLKWYISIFNLDLGAYVCGSLYLSKRISTTSFPTSLRVELSLKHVFETIFMKGYLTKLKWIDQWYIKHGKKCFIGPCHTMLDITCKYGKLNMLKYAYDIYNLKGQKSIIIDNRCIHRACEYGHLHIIKWIISEFGITKHDIISDNYLILKYAYGQSLKWLIKQFDLNKIKV